MGATRFRKRARTRARLRALVSALEYRDALRRCELADTDRHLADRVFAAHEVLANRAERRTVTVRLSEVDYPTE